MKKNVEKTLGVLIAAGIVVVFVAFVFIIKLFTSPDVTVGGLPVFSWENIKTTAIMFGIAGIVVFLCTVVQGDKKGDDE